MIALAESGVYNGIALLYLDLDNFKLVNDRRGFGHGFGNEMLRGVARILENGTRKPSRGGPADVVARPETSLTSESTGAADDESPEGEVIRPHGDEFIILILDTGPAITTRAPHPSRQTEEQPLSSDDRALRIASRFTNPITEYMNRITRGEIPGLGVSIGYALWRPGMDEEDLIRAGDWAMYEVKRARKTGDSPEQPQR
jgi:GGDEF domain-containing protein